MKNLRSKESRTGINDPMAYAAHILLGTITKLYGFEGAVTVKLEKSFVENIPVTESVFLEIEGKPVPFFISESDYNGGDILRLSFDGYGSAEKVREFQGCRVFLTSDETDASEIKGHSGITGFSLHNQDKTLIGNIKKVSENPGQVLINVQTPGGKNILIPLHEDLIVSVDNKNRIIIMDLPVGLLDINK